MAIRWLASITRPCILRSPSTRKRYRHHLHVRAVWEASQQTSHMRLQIFVVVLAQAAGHEQFKEGSGM